MDVHENHKGTTMKPIRNLMLMLPLLLLPGCKTEHTVNTNSVVEVKPIKIEPIYATININVKIDKELDSFFDYEETLQPVKN
jgi:hypothetical protein